MMHLCSGSPMHIYSNVDACLLSDVFHWIRTPDLCNLEAWYIVNGVSCRQPILLTPRSWRPIVRKSSEPCACATAKGDKLPGFRAQDSSLPTPSEIDAIFPDNVVVVFAAKADWDSSLHPAEAAAISQASPKRRREFAAGRSCSRIALAQLGIRGYPLLPQPDRVPNWPKGIVGSLSHCNDACIAAVALSSNYLGVGVDIEAAGQLPENIRSMVCTPGEEEWMSLRAPPHFADWGTVAFSCKESVYKCLYPIHGELLEFDDVELLTTTIYTAFTASVPRLKRQIACRWCSTSEHVISTAYVRA